MLNGQGDRKQIHQYTSLLNAEHVILQVTISGKELFISHFQGMTEKKVTYEELELARHQLIKTIDEALTDQDRSFLLSVKAGKPQWDLAGLPASMESLPGVRWKLMNIQRMPPGKHKEMLKKLEDKLCKAN